MPIISPLEKKDLSEKQQRKNAKTVNSSGGSRALQQQKSLTSGGGQQQRGEISSMPVDWMVCKGAMRVFFQRRSAVVKGGYPERKPQPEEYCTVWKSRPYFGGRKGLKLSKRKRGFTPARDKIMD